MTTIKLSEAKNKLSQIVKDTAETTEPVTIAVHGRKQVVLLSSEEYDSLKETLAVLSDQDLVKQIVGSMADIANGDVVNFDEIKEDV